MSGYGTPVSERDRYERAGWRERIPGLRSSIRAHPHLAIATAILLGVWAVLLATRPTYVTLDDLVAGDCLYVRTVTTADVPQGILVGSTTGVTGSGPTFAERAACDANHSHEVAGIIDLRPFGADYMALGEHLPAMEASCVSAFVDRLGGGVSSDLEPVLLLPTEEGWAEGIRSTGCLIQRVDGQFLDRPAREVPAPTTG